MWPISFRACALLVYFVQLLRCSLPLAHHHNAAHKGNDEAAQSPRDNEKTPMLLIEHNITSSAMGSAELPSGMSKVFWLLLA